jgi:Spy/CpxP family protein refolding chaperone
MMRGMGRPSPMLSPAPMQNSPAGSAVKGSVSEKLAEVQAQLSRLETTLKQLHPGDSSMGAPEGKMPKGQDGEMNGMNKMPMEKGGMDKGGMDKMPMDKGGMDKMMGMMGRADPAVMVPSALPGFPGASHLYHIGAPGFFLDHSEHLTLSVEQQQSLNHIKEAALLAKASAERQIAQAEQELWELTAADQPDVSNLEAKVGAIEKVRGDERLAYIRSVGEAAKVLTDEQRKTLTGLAASASTPVPMPMPTPSPSAAAPASSPMPAGGMNDM